MEKKSGVETLPALNQGWNPLKEKSGWRNGLQLFLGSLLNSWEEDKMASNAISMPDRMVSGRL